MGWMLSIWIFALPALYTWKTAAYEAKSLSASGYHLCIYNETRAVTSSVLRRVPYTERKSCGGWLFWTACPVTLFRLVHQTEYRMMMEQVTRCCHGYAQVGSYCAPSLNRSKEFLPKPGSCPTTNESYSSVDDCDWDIDCPDWQKCCERSGSANYTENGRYRFNATVTVKTDYQQLTNNGALINHTRLLHAMVSGALESVDFAAYYLSSWPVHPHRTATSLLIDSSFALSPRDVASKLRLLLQRIREVLAVTVEDVNECAHPALHQCPPLAECRNAVGSYQCTCHGGHLDVNPSDPGTRCEDAQTLDATTRLTNVSFTDDPLDTSSQAYKKLTADILDEDCVQRTGCPSNTIGRAFGSPGPLLKSEEVPPESPNERLQLIGLSFLGIAVILFFLIGSVCLFFYQRNRIGHDNFASKPKPLNVADIHFIA
ncbi:uromodulin-like 1 isoform X2 [Festucalex cinctus]